MKWVLLLIVLFFILPVTYAATISGGVYDATLDNVPKVVVEINSTPVQTMVSRYGGFQFEVDEGAYKITVSLTQSGITRLIAEDYFVVSDDGEYRRDLFVFPDINLTEGFNETVLSNSSQDELSLSMKVLFVFCMAFILGGIAYYLFSGKQKKAVASTEPLQPDNILKEKIIFLIKERKGEATQKYIRNHLHVSESRVSLLVAALEAEGSIEKVKQGRTNVLRLRQHDQ